MQITTPLNQKQLRLLHTIYRKIAPPHKVFALVASQKLLAETIHTWVWLWFGNNSHI